MGSTPGPVLFLHPARPGQCVRQRQQSRELASGVHSPHKTWLTVFTCVASFMLSDKPSLPYSHFMMKANDKRG